MLRKYMVNYFVEIANVNKKLFNYNILWVH